MPVLNQAYPEGTGGGGESAIAWYPSINSFGDISWTRSSSATPPQTTNIKGPQGEQGEAGPAGERGEQGESGVAAIRLTLSSESWSNNTQTAENALFLSDGYVYKLLPNEYGITADDITVDGQITFHCISVPTADAEIYVFRFEEA